MALTVVQHFSVSFAQLYIFYNLVICVQVFVLPYTHYINWYHMLAAFQDIT